MSRMTESQRSQFERAELGYTGDRLSRATPRGERALSVLTPIFIVILGLLVFAAYQAFDGWPHAVVIIDLVVVTFALATWLYSSNKG
jgi:hypothetical protein